MGYCDDLLTTLEALLAATTALQCCGDQDITDGKQYTDEIVDGVGDVPQNIIDAGYATDAADWSGFDDYKCMISHLAVEHVETFFREISPFINDTKIVVGGIGVVGALLGGILVVVGLPISAGILVALGAAAGIWTWISAYGRSAVDDLADEIATNHDALACAIYQSDGVSAAIDAFNTEVDSLFSTIDAIAIKAIGFEPQLRAMYAGRYDQEDIAAKLEDLGYSVGGYTCSCVVTYDVDMEYDFADGIQGWQINGRCYFPGGGAHCNSEQDGIGFNAGSGNAAWGQERVDQMLAFHSYPALTGGEKFFVQHMKFYWRPCPEVVQDPDFHLEGVRYHPQGFDYEVAGYYEKNFTSGNEPEMVANDEIGIWSPTQGGETEFINMGWMYYFRVAGFVAEGS